VLLLALAPAWKLAERLRRPGARPVGVLAREEGRALFVHEWTQNDALASGDGLGPVFNARSCVDCHSQGGPGGGGPVDKNVTVYGIPERADAHGLPRSGVVHQKSVSPDFQETLALVHPQLPNEPRLSLGAILNGDGARIPGVLISQRNTPALFGDGLIDAVTDDAIIAHQREHSDAARLVGLNGARDAKVRGRVARLVDGRIGRFGWKGEFATLNDFVKAACANEIGLSNPGRAQPTPLGAPGFQAKGTDLTDAQCVLMSDFLRTLDRPREVVSTNPTERAAVESGRTLFATVGCADCHSPKLGTLDGLYSDLLLHDMGVGLESSPGSYGQPPVPVPQFDRSALPIPGEWRTPPLWGVADSAPYLHDGRADSLDRAIELHGGEAEDVAARYKEMAYPDREAIIAFLKTLRAPSVGVSVAAR
jgi:CxxC motif-containing protein (DUF1111 family)